MALRLNGSTSGYVEIDAPAVAGTTAITVPATSGEFVVADSSGNIDLGALDISGSAAADSVNIDSSGRLGIGTSSPTQLLEVKGSNAQIVVNGTTTTDSGIEFQNDGTSFAEIKLDTPSGILDISETQTLGTITLSTGASRTERMRIIGDGRVSINSTSIPGAESLNVKESPGFNDYCILTHVTGTGNKYHMRFLNANGVIGSIKSGANNITYNTSSDYRLKENIEPVADGITRLQQLNPSRFNFISDPNTTVDGFIAHEVQSVVPEAITGAKDEVEVWKEGETLPDGVSVGDNKLDEDGNTIPVYQGIDQSKLVPLLTAALQEAISKIETLETANASLEARLDALEGGAS